MKHLLRALFVAAVVVGFTVTAHAGFLEKVGLEDSYTTKAQNTLDRVYGHGNFVVNVTVLMTNESWSMTYTEQAKAKATAKGPQKQINILPGYPVIKNLAPDGNDVIPFNSRLSKSPAVLNKVIVDLVVNSDFPRAEEKRAEAMLMEILGLKPGRDVIRAQFKSFSDFNAAADPTVFTSTGNMGGAGGFKLFSAQGILSVLALLTFLGFVGLYAFFQFSQGTALRALASKKDSGSGSGGATTVTMAPVDTPKSDASGPSGDLKLVPAPQIKKYFDFISEDNIEGLIYIIKKEAMSIENVTIIVSYLSADLAAKVMKSLELEGQAFITLNILDQKMVNRAALDKLESQVKGAVECLIGGQSAVSSIFNHFGAETKRQLMQVLASADQDKYQRLRRLIVLFEDLGVLSEDELRLLVSEINFERMALAMVGIEADLRQRFEAVLPRSTRDMIKQYMDLKGKSVQPQEVEAAQDYILGVADKLESNGRIALREKIQG
ncbi:MAG: FliG C-terminal domain-containing protein [Candidatus Margulisiibacteriota bacterium]